MGDLYYYKLDAIGTDAIGTDAIETLYEKLPKRNKKRIKNKQELI